jgi:probable O-glycosylation ligase (exosortase A-associated)
MRIITLLLIYYGSALYALFNPLFGLFFFIHITILRPESLAWGNLAFGRLHLTTAIITLLGYFTNRESHQNNINTNYQRVNIFIFLGFNVWLFIVTLLAESSVELSFDKAIEVTKVFILCFLFSKLILTESHIKLYVWVTSISFGLLSLWGFQQGLAGNPRLDTLWPGGSNYVAAQLTLMAPFVLAKTLDTKLSLQYKLVFLACTISICLCSIYTASRGGFIGLSIGLFMFIIRIRARPKVLVSVALLIVVIYPWVPPTFLERVSSISASEGERDESSAARPILWGIALRIWRDHPIAGVGLENFSLVKEAYIDKVHDLVTSQEMFEHIFNRERRPHGLYFGMLAETGLVGLGLFIVLVFRNTFCRFSASLAKSESDRSLYLQAVGAQCGLMGFIVEATFGDFQYIEMLYLQLFFIGAVRVYADNLINRVSVNDLEEPKQILLPASLIHT